MIRSAFLVTIGSVASLIAGMTSQIVVAWYFGTSYAMDAFLAAFVIPAYIQALFLTGLPFVLLPAFIREREGGRDEDAWALIGTFVRILGPGMTVLAIAGSIAAPIIIRISAPGLSSSSAEMAARMLAVLMFNVPLVTLSSISTGVQNARGRFLWPAAAPALGSLANIAVVVAGYRTIGATALAYGALASSLVQAGVTFGPVLKHGWQYVIPLSDQRVRRAVRLLSPIVLFGLLGRASPVLERYFASRLAEGSISYLGYAGRISVLVQVLLGTGIVTAIFPDMVRGSVASGKAGVLEQYQKALRFTLVITLPAVALLSVLALPAVQLVFQRGQFTFQSAASTAAVLPLVLGTVLCNIFGDVIGRALYAQGKTFGFNLAGAIAIVFYPVLAGIAVPGMGYRGLALANLGVNVLGVVMGLFLLRRELGHIRAGFVPQYALCSLMAALVSWCILQIDIIRASPVLALALGGSGGLITYVLCLAKADKDMIKTALNRVGGTGRLLAVISARPKRR
ncbi:MAG: lipid II flippase MurJ [Candidatus Eisenbacteria bacterium]|nr:lipid II flippase MurJ [Candidatus Eisenbacteria bacterium]